MTLNDSDLLPKELVTTIDPTNPTIEQDNQLPSSAINKLFSEFKIPNVTSYAVAYKGLSNTAYKNIDSTDNSTKYTLNIHHKADNNPSDANTQNSKTGNFYISFSSPYHRTESFYGRDIDNANVMDNKHVNTKSIILSKAEYDDAVQWANTQSMHRVKDGNIYDIGNIDSRNFIQDIWHKIGRPLYFTVAYTTDEITNLGTASATALLSKYGSFDVMKQGKFVDKDLSKDALASRLNIEVGRISDISTGLDEHTNLLKSFVVNIDDKLITTARTGVVPENCKVIIKYNNTYSHEEDRNSNSFNEVQDIVTSIMQQYKDGFENRLEFTQCGDWKRDLKDEYNQRQASLFDTRYELIVDSFHPAPNVTHFVKYILGSQLGPFTGSMRYHHEALNIHMWYVSQILQCSSIGHYILGYDIDVPKEEVANLVNNITQHWNNKIDSLISRPEFNNLQNISDISFNSTNNIPKLISDTLYREMSSLGFKKYIESGAKSHKVERYVECEDMVDSTSHVSSTAKISIEQNEMGYNTDCCSEDYKYTKSFTSNAASGIKPVGYNIMQLLKDKTEQLVSFNPIKQIYNWLNHNTKIQDNKITSHDNKIIVDNDNIENGVSKGLRLEHDIAGERLLSNKDNLNHINSSLNNCDAISGSINSNILTQQGNLLLLGVLIHKKNGTKYSHHKVVVSSKDDTDTIYTHNLAYSAYSPENNMLPESTTSNSAVYIKDAMEDAELLGLNVTH